MIDFFANDVIVPTNDVIVPTNDAIPCPAALWQAGALMCHIHTRPAP